MGNTCCVNNNSFIETQSTDLRTVPEQKSNKPVRICPTAADSSLSQPTGAQLINRNTFLSGYSTTVKCSVNGATGPESDPDGPSPFSRQDSSVGAKAAP